MVGKYNNKVFDFFNYMLFIFLALITVYPIWDCFIVSIIPVGEYLKGSIHLWPKQIDLSAYKYIFGMKELWRSYGVTIYVTIVGTLVNITLTTMTAYVLSKRGLKGQRVIMFLIIFTMMFSGGLIPSYILIKNLKLMNTLWALILPGAIATYNLIIMKTFFEGLPASLEESAKIDGCNDMGILIKIIVPISLPAIATISLFYAVSQWNQFFAAVMYITDKTKYPLQLFLRAMLFENEAAMQGGGDSPFLLGMPIKMATVLVAVIPIICVYPFFQKYFVKGVLIGAVKG